MVSSNLIHKAYKEIYENNFLEYGISNDFYHICRKKCIKWEDLAFNEFYIYIYAKKGKVTSVGSSEEIIYTEGYILGFDFWQKEDSLGGAAPPAGRMSSYGDEHLYVKVI